MTEKEEGVQTTSPVSAPFQTTVAPQKTALVPDQMGEMQVVSLPLTTMPIEPEKPTHGGYNYWHHLPYDVESDETRVENLNLLIEDLYLYVKAGDFEGGARTASRQIKRWLTLKFKMPKETRKKLVQFYYELSLTPGIDPSATDTFATMFRLLAVYFLL